MSAPNEPSVPQQWKAATLWQRALWWVRKMITARSSRENQETCVREIYSIGCDQKSNNVKKWRVSKCCWPREKCPGEANGYMQTGPLGGTGVLEVSDAEAGGGIGHHGRLELRGGRVPAAEGRSGGRCRTRECLSAWRRKLKDERKWVGVWVWMLTKDRHCTLRSLKIKLIGFLCLIITAAVLASKCHLCFSHSKIDDKNRKFVRRAGKLRIIGPGTESPELWQRTKAFSKPECMIGKAGNFPRELASGIKCQINPSITCIRMFFFFKEINTQPQHPFPEKKAW